MCWRVAGVWLRVAASSTDSPGVGLRPPRLSVGVSTEPHTLHPTLGARQAYLVDVAQVPVDTRAADGTTPLQLALYGGHAPDTASALQQRGADVSATNDWGCSCAHWAAMGGHVDSARWLQPSVAAGLLSFDEPQRDGQTPLHKARSLGRPSGATPQRRAGYD